VTQSVLVAQVVRQLVALAHLRLFGHAAGVPAAQVPLPLQALAVSMFPVQVAVPHEVVVAGYVQAPEVSQAVAPQVASLVEQAALQQWPLPLIPQIVERHCELAEHAAPFARPPVPPVVVPPVAAPVVPPVIPVVPVTPPVVVPPSVVVDEPHPEAKNPPNPTAKTAAAKVRMRDPFSTE
jgi:hypothetical protein